MKGQRASWLKGPFLESLVNPSETMVPSLRGGAWGRVSCTALPGVSWGRLAAEYNIGRRGLQDAFGPGFILSQVTVSVEEVFIVTPHWVDKMAPDIVIPPCIWHAWQWLLTVY